MAYRFAPPPAPKVPQTTPASIRARLRAPIVNPYDKFTQPEFDAWIGDLTSALKRALGREDLPPRAQFSEARRHERDTSAYDDEGVMEDSFAEVKERRAAKGKERAIMTDEEEVESMILGPDLEPLEDSEEEESDIQDERWGHPDHFGWARAAQDEDELAEASDGDSDILSVQQGPDEAIEISSDEDEDELVADGSSSPAAADNEEEYEDEDEEEARSDEEEEEEDELQYEDVEEDRTPDHLQVHEEVEIEEEEAVQPKDAEPKDTFPPSQGAAGVVEIQDPWTGPSTHERDFYSGGDIPQSSLRTGSAHMLPTEEDEIEQVEDDTGAEFPPVSAFPHSVELLDPWDGPRTYAEDFYSGGEIPPNSAYLSPSHLTPLATTPRDELDLGLDITLLLTPETATVTPVVIDVGGDRELKFQFEAGGEGDVLVLGADEVENVPTFTMTDDTGMEGAESHALHETDFDAPAFEDLYGSLGEEAAPEVRAEAERVEETQPNDVVADLITPEVSLDTANRGHVDWNHPPAFLSGRAASGPGHLKAPETQSDSRSHIIEGNRSISPEVLEISDDSVEVDVGSSVHITETEATIHTPTLQEDYEESDGRAQEDDLDFTDSFTSGNILASSAIPSVDDMSFEVQDEQRESLFQELESMYMANQAAFNNLQSSALEDDTGVSQNANAVLEFNFLEGAVAEDLPLTAEEAEILEVFTQFDKPGQNGTPHTDVPDTTAEATDVLQGAEIAELDLDASEEVEREDYEDEEPAVQEMHEEVVGMLYVVTEFDTDDEQEGIDELIYDDVATDAEDGAVMVLRYEVEEVITEGRRTVDPEDPEESLAFETKQPTPEPPAVVDVADSLPALDVAEDVQQPEAPSTSESADVLLSSRRPGAVESEDSAYPSKDGETTEGIATNALDLEYPLSPSFPEMDVTTSTDEPQVVITSADAQEEQSTPALETGIPMPISADPSVPDPAEAQEDDSMADDTTSGPSTASKFAIPNAIPRSLFSRLSAHKSGSGLFTPLTEQDSSPAGSIHTSEDGLVVEQSLAEPDRSSPVEESDLPRGQSEGVPRDVVISEVDGRDAKADALSTLVLRENTSILAPPVDAPEESKTSVVVAQKVSYETAAGAHDPDLDADGDVDSDYEPNDSIRSSRQGDSPPRVKDGDVDPANHLARQLPTDPGTEVTSSHHTIEQGLDVSVPVEAQSPPQVDSSEPVSSLGTELPVIKEGREDLTSSAKVGEDHPESADKQSDDARSSSLNESRPLKRKRKIPVPGLPRMTRSRSAKEQFRPSTAGVNTLSEKSKGKQKAKIKEIDDESASPEPTQSSSRSDDSRRSPSRASSVMSFASSALSTSPDVIEPPRTLVRNIGSLPLLHTHGILHHHSRPQVLIPSPQAEQSTSRQPSATPLPVDPSPLNPPSPAAPPTSTPVTRSHCRFHKISLPREENGPRVFFVTPGCSLSNRELMEEHEIEDHGDATEEDQMHLIPDIESLDFSSYLLGILRQLVGVDLLREQEIFYLVQPGEHPRWKSRRKPKHKPRETISARAASNVSSPRISRRAGPSFEKPPVSTADSVSTSASARTHLSAQRSTPTVGASISEAEVSDREDGPAVKRKRKKGNATSPPAPPSESVPPAASPSTTQPTIRPARRSKRLGVDAAAYKPDKNTDDNSTDDAKPGKGRRRKLAQRGTKRNREAESVNGVDQGESAGSKRRKLTPSAPEEVTA